MHLGESEESSQWRDDDCGMLAFHAGTKAALLKHVHLEVTKSKHCWDKQHFGASY
jgi:hypothetical protein